MKVSSRILPVIVIAQFCCTSLWFAGNGVMSDLLVSFNLNEEALGHLTSAVQLGFISGTLSFAFLTISDRFSPSRVFFVCAILGALFNFGILLENNTLLTLILFRFLTGFALAGIYPVGMKIAADYFDKGLGKSLGFLVGALVIGTGFPHLLKEFSSNYAITWNAVIMLTSGLALLGGVLILSLVPDGPFRSQRQKPDLGLAYKVFRNRDFRAAAFGYFGHMWELYAFWAFVPVILSYFQQENASAEFSIPLMSFIVIGSGGLACIAGGYISEIFGTKKTAGSALFLSGLCCLLSPLVFISDSQILLISFLIFWGLMVVADSPLFSTLVAQNTPPESRGTALTIVNCLGFSITIASIQALNYLNNILNPYFLFIFLSLGPLLGLIYLFKKSKK